MDPELNPTTALKSLMSLHMCLAIECEKLKDIKLLLQYGINVNEPIITSGEFAGFTSLHVACMKNKDHLVELLINDYKADVNAMAADGTQPIHLACFYQPLDKISNESAFLKSDSNIKTLVKANANVNAEFGQEIFSKHVKDREWCPDFGDKMPLVAYTFIYEKPALISHLGKINVNIISLTNKTLLMYAVEKKYFTYIHAIMSHVQEDSILMDKLVNQRDNDNVPLTHYPFYLKKCGKFGYHKSTLFKQSDLSSFIFNLSCRGADMYALINNDPATFLPNLFAYRRCSDLLKKFLPYYTSMSLSRVLYYATLPVEEWHEHLVRHDSVEHRLDHIEKIIKNKDSIAIALKDLVFRKVFRLPVPEEEIKLMDKLIASDQNLRQIVDNYKINFIKDELQVHFIKFGDNKMTMYDFLMQVFDNKKLKFLVREENLLDALDKVFKHRIVYSYRNTDVYCFYHAYHYPIRTRVKDAKERLRLFENLNKISSLRKAIPLPYELVLYIVEYLNNKHLNVFIKAFYSS